MPNSQPAAPAPAESAAASPAKLAPAAESVPGPSPSPSSPRRVAFKTLGCKLNQAETEAAAAGFKNLGWDITPFGEPADAVVINSCTVTNAADRKSRAAMNSALRIPAASSAVTAPAPAAAAHAASAAVPVPVPATASAAAAARPPGRSTPVPVPVPVSIPILDKPVSPPLVVMTGCYADGHRESLEADGRTYVVGNAHKSRIPQLVDAHFRGEMLPGRLEEDRDPFGYPAAAPVFRTRAMVKIQDGCENYCTFCIIPFVRGRAASRPLPETVAAVEQAAASGYREIVLTGVNMSRWEDGRLRFVDLVEACLNAQGDFRLRLGSIEPDRLDIPRLIDLMSHPRITPHMHLCLQSGSEKILLAMRRQYTAAAYRSIAQEFRRRVPGFNLTTDIIVGFPGESEADFAETLGLCEELQFGHIHTFPYSRRTGTRADRMAQQVPAEVIKERSEAVRSLSAKSKRRFRSAMRGSLQDVLVERADPDLKPRPSAPNAPASLGFSVRGLSANYVPVRFSLPAGRFSPDVPRNVRQNIQQNVQQNVRNTSFRVRIDSIDTGEDPDLIGTPELRSS